jgi:hypothetical protein
MRWAFDQGTDELYAGAAEQHPRDHHREAARMEWVGETEKYNDLRLQVYRIRASELT